MQEYTLGKKGASSTTFLYPIYKNIPQLERSPGEGNGNPLQYSCLENSMDQGAS